MRTVIVATIFILLSCPVLAGDMVFGFPMAEPLTVAECARGKYGYDLPSKGAPCFERSDAGAGSKAPVLNETIRIKFALFEGPSIATGELVALVMEGRLEGLVFNTRGIDNQSEVLAALKGKYGEPTIFQPQTVQNRMGAKFEVFDAIWTTPTLNIAFQSTMSSITSGSVSIDTKKGSNWRHEQLQRFTQDKRPL